jgi:hypothetical protein
VIQTERTDRATGTTDNSHQTGALSDAYLEIEAE